MEKEPLTGGSEPLTGGSSNATPPSRPGLRVRYICVCSAVLAAGACVFKLLWGSRVNQPGTSLMGSPSTQREFIPSNPDLQARIGSLINCAQSIDWDMRAINLWLNNETLLNITDGIHYHINGNRWTPDELNTFAVGIYEKHVNQTIADVNRLQHKWSSRVIIGEVNVWDLLMLLHFTIDHSDSLLHYTSQFVHCLQVYGMVSRTEFPSDQYDAEYKADMQIVALVHDLGKLLTVFGEKDYNVDCMNTVIRHGESGHGLASLVAQWNHDEYGYQKLKSNTLLSRRVLTAVRFHSLREVTGEFAHQYGNSVTNVTRQDVDKFNNALTPADKENLKFVKHFRSFDQGSKVRTDAVPGINLTEVQNFLDTYFTGGKMLW